jgi:hypothetical protein
MDLEWDVIFQRTANVHTTPLVHLALWALTKQNKPAFSALDDLNLEIDRLRIDGLSLQR